MRILKLKKQKFIQFDVTTKELNVLQMALDDYYCFLDYSLKNNIIKSNSCDDVQYDLTESIRKRFKNQRKILEPMLEIINLFY